MPSMSFSCRPDMHDGTWFLGDYTLNPQGPVQRVVNGGSISRYHSILGPALVHPPMTHGGWSSNLRARHSPTYCPHHSKTTLKMGAPGIGVPNWSSRDFLTTKFFKASLLSSSYLPVMHHVPNKTVSSILLRVRRNDETNDHLR